MLSATGTASGSTYLRGDNTWATVSGTGDLLADGTIPLTANWDVGAFTITGTQFISDISTGTAPFVVSSTTEVANLKAASSTLADTVTTNENLTGDVTSSGNATTIAAGAVDLAMLSATGTASGTTYLRGDNTWATVSGSGDALVANPLSQFAATTSAQLAGVISDETGTGAVVLANAPALINPTGIDTGDVSEVTDKNYVTDAEATVIGNTSGYNSGDIPEASQTWVIDSPAVGGIYGPRIDTARTIDRVQIWTDTGTVDLNVEIRTAPNTSGTNSMTSDLQATSSSVAQTTFADDTIAAGEYLYIDISAVASSPTVLGVTVSYE
jgi:hypothetical protein